MKRIVLSMMLGMSLLAQAAPGTYNGGGTDRTSVDAPTSYRGTLVVKALPGDIKELTETYQMGSQTLKFVSTFRFLSDGQIVVRRNGEVVGTGHYHDFPEGRWANYTVATDVGPLQVSMFYSHREEAIYRTGTVGGQDGKVHYWADKYNKVAE